MDSTAGRLDARRPFGVVLLSFAVLFALDAAIYRSGLYASVSSTASVAGHFAMVVRWSIAQPPSPKKDVLVVGHSKIEAALSGKIFDQENPDSQLRLVFASSGGTTEKIWYYLLEHVDPNRDKYAAIVIPIDSYATQAFDYDYENTITNVQAVAPILDTREWPEFIGTFTTPEARAKVTLAALVSSHVYAVDLQDLLLHPVARYEALAWAKKTAQTFLYDFDGFDGDLTTFEHDPATGKVLRAPPHLDAFRRREAEWSCYPLPADKAPAWTARYHAFRTHWFRRIVERYAGSSTLLFFLQVPRWPFELATWWPIDGAPDVREVVKPSANVVVLPPEEFEDLEKPEYFYDVFHVNKKARAIFTKRFAKDLRAALHD